MSASAPPEGQGAAAAPRRRGRSRAASTHVTLRWLHTYTSMISLLVVLFFALTGLTLNHPDWVFGPEEVKSEVTGTLPSGWITKGTVDWLTVAEELRASQHLRGRAGDARVDGQEASLSFLGPGYAADVFIDTATGRYTANVLQQGGLAVINDLHRGRDTGTAWRWVIDLSGGVLALVAFTGIGILLYLKKTRVQALGVMGVASVLVLVLAWHAVA